MAKLFHTFWQFKVFQWQTIQQLNTLNLAAEFVQQTKEIGNPFYGLGEATESRLWYLCRKRTINANRKRLHPFLFSSSFHCFQTHKGNAPDTAQMNAKVREMIKEALQKWRCRRNFQTRWWSRNQNKTFLMKTIWLRLRKSNCQIRKSNCFNSIS